MLATAVQIVSLCLFVAAGAIAGLPAFLAALAVAGLYVGVAMDRGR